MSLVPEGRWSLIPWGHPAPEEQAIQAARRLLVRYGVVAREIAALERAGKAGAAIRLDLREEGRGGPFAQPPAKEPRKPKEPEAKVVLVTNFQDPMREMDKLHTLYDSLMDARKKAGEDPVPFHKFAALVKDQVTKLRDSGTSEVAFGVAVKDGNVNFTVRGLKGGGT